MFSPFPIMLIAGENALSRYYPEDVYKMASEAKEPVYVPNADRLNWSDGTEVIPFDKLILFFNEHQKSGKAAQVEGARGNGSEQNESVIVRVFLNK